MRKSGFYPHLALTNVLRNGQFYLPYFLTCSCNHRHVLYPVLSGLQ